MADGPRPQRQEGVEGDLDAQRPRLRQPAPDRRLAIGLREAVVGPQAVAREHAARAQPPGRERQRQPVGGHDAQEPPPRVGAHRGHRLPALAGDHERAVQQEARDAEEDRHADLQAHGEVADERARVLGAGEEGGVGAEDRDRGDGAQGSTRGKRSPAVRIADHTVSVGRPTRGFAAPAGRPRRGRRRAARALPVHGRPPRHRRRRLALLPPGRRTSSPEGTGFIEPYKWLFDHRASPSAGHPPLYPLALAAVSKLGGTSELSHRALGLILGAGDDRRSSGCSAAGRAASGVGLIAAGLCAVYPLMIAVDGALMSETLYGPLIVRRAARRVAAARPSRARGPRWSRAWRSALAALTRSEALLLVPAAGLARGVARRAGLAAARRAGDGSAARWCSRRGPIRNADRVRRARCRSPPTTRP